MSNPEEIDKKLEIGEDKARVHRLGGAQSREKKIRLPISQCRYLSSFL